MHEIMETRLFGSMWQLGKKALQALLAREARRMSLAESTMRPFTALERVLSTPPGGCSGLAA